ncbi:MAG: hypothetical protein ACD_3C00201G0001 [uncultured bacterium (gcode 4)]|uniref:Uncharacterized protein n=1 Tax=uncultured bacterium (gcode 4) TaxID=1234023 RepID=K2GVW0_9BACT|nr:MAG: hypothetical protein ACD_3C00201G0001 [uncultured bacterium (gcode 4)]
MFFSFSRFFQFLFFCFRLCFLCLCSQKNCIFRQQINIGLKCRIFRIQCTQSVQLVQLEYPKNSIWNISSLFPRAVSSSSGLFAYEWNSAFHINIVKMRCLYSKPCSNFFIFWLFFGLFCSFDLYLSRLFKLLIIWSLNLIYENIHFLKIRNGFAQFYAVLVCGFNDEIFFVYSFKSKIYYLIMVISKISTSTQSHPFHLLQLYIYLLIYLNLILEILEFSSCICFCISLLAIFWSCFFLENPYEFICALDLFGRRLVCSIPKTIPDRFKMCIKFGIFLAFFSRFIHLFNRWWFFDIWHKNKVNKKYLT